jgi:hypothetical protein
LKLAAISAKELREVVEADFRFSSTPTAFRIGFIAEHLRAIVALEAQNLLNEDRYPVPTLRITHLVKARLNSLGLLNSENFGTPLEELDHLARISDLVRFDGRWSLGPVRQVEVDSTCTLLVGGGPCQLLFPRLRQDVQIAGRARILLLSEKNRAQAKGMPVQRLDDWLGLPYKDINKWRDAFLKSSVKSLCQPFEMENAVFWSNGRWVPIDRCTGSADWLLFRKAVTIFGNPTSAYGVARIKLGSDQLPKILGICDIERNDARRLQGILDVASPTPRRLQYFHSHELVIIRLHHPLPFPESNFLSLGWPASSLDTAKPWPKDFSFASALLPLLKRILICLGYELIQKNNGTN